MEDKLNFLPADKDENLLQMMGMFKHSQSSQNSSITMSLQYLKKEVRDEVNFLHGDKDQSFLQVGMTKHLQSTQSNKSYLYNISKQKFEMTFIFYMQINIAIGIVVLMGVAGHVQVTQSTSIIQNIQIFTRGGGRGGGGGVHLSLLLLVHNKNNINLFERKNNDKKICSTKKHFVIRNFRVIKGL